MPAKKYKIEDFYGLENARRPWADAKAPEGSREMNFRGCDTQDRIDVCLSCKKAKCSGNCLKVKGKEKYVNPEILERRKRVLELRAQELTYQQIAERLGCTKTIVNADLRAMRAQGVFA